ncbi:DUF664 domain-containing protein [Cohnella sp. CFH 77786]|uniref:DinB family protein n=1 Tax=Cohnella sp. CFH 77786 TaxID=2662265 RepID=UPI001C60E40F|nr:DinB family protein [Cohnella sp. CFH 77786]MBW5446526.1 DUF664 domain-containing protein [Cohnella sp. CFH 77786]
MLDLEKIYLISDMPGYSPQISRLLSMMNYARHTTLQAVQDLSVEQLDYLIDGESNSIGALLLHFAAVEYAYQVSTFEKRDLNDEEMSHWGAALDLGDEGRKKIKGNDLAYYLNQLEAVRKRTYELFKTVDDDWLYREEVFWYNKRANHYFMWFHVFEDEINHRGQIRMIKKRLRS